MLRRRIEKLELALAGCSYEEEAQSLRFAAYDRLEHPDRMVIVHLARRYGNGEEVEITPDISAVMARWSDIAARIKSEGRQDLSSRVHRGWN
jgi:hypothetical protein